MYSEESGRNGDYSPLKKVSNVIYQIYSEDDPYMKILKKVLSKLKEENPIFRYFIHILYRKKFELTFIFYFHRENDYL